MAATHTPGPWKVIVAGNTWGVVPVNARGKPRDGRSTEDVAQGNTLRDDWESNARLIAAAPELLAAVKGLLEIAHGAFDAGGAAFADPRGVDSRIVTAQRAVEKATGAP